MYVSEADYEKYSDRWDELAESGNMKHTCSTCAHDGQCDNLHHCGGSCWESAFVECDQCGCEIHFEEVDFSDEDGHNWCSEECMNDWQADNGEEEEGGEE